MLVEVKNVYSRAVQLRNDEREWIVDYLAFEDPSSRFRPSGPRPVHMFNLFSNTFPTGLLDPVRKAAAEAGIDVQVIDKRGVPCMPDVNADLAWLRPYQKAAVLKLAERRRGIIWAPTGAGKTEMFVGLTRYLPCRWVFVVHRVGLVKQARDRYLLRAREHGVDVPEPGVIGEGEWRVAEGPAAVTFASFQTLAKCLKEKDQRAIDALGSFEAVAVDEVHTLPAGTFLNVAMSIPRAYYRAGFSGTPLARGDQKSMLAIAAVGPVIYRIKPDVLIGAGVLAKPRIRMLPVDQQDGGGSWAEVYRELVVKSSKRNRAVVEACKRAERPMFVFVTHTNHGKALSRMLWQAGVRNEFVWGTHSTDYREAMVRRLESADLDAIVCSVVFQEGIDVPALRSVVVASGGKSVIAALQRIGRGMRVEKDRAGNVVKDTFEVWDFLDEGNKWTARHARARRNAYMTEGFETVVEQPSPLFAAEAK